MTKDGLVEVNQTTGEEARISQRGQDFEMRRDTPDHQSFSGREAPAVPSRRDAQATRGAGAAPYALEPGASGIRQHDAPMHAGELRPTDPPASSSPPTRSLWDTAHPAPGEASQGGSRRSSRQQRFAENAAGPEERHPQGRSAAGAPTEGTNSPDVAPESGNRAALPDIESVPHRPSMPPGSRAPEMDAHPEGERSSLEDGRSRLRFGVGSVQIIKVYIIGFQVFQRRCKVIAQCLLQTRSVFLRRNIQLGCKHYILPERCCRFTKNLFVVPNVIEWRSIDLRSVKKGAT